MASSSPRESLQGEAVCPICWEYYVKPIILDCGHNFCLACISECWKEFPDNTACPQCRAAVERSNCRLNTPLANMVQIVKQLSSQGRDEGAWVKVCAAHPEPSRAVFCKDDEVIFCQACAGSEQHRDHCQAPVEEAARMYKDCFFSYIEVLKKERAEIVKLKVNVAEWGDQLLRNTYSENQAITAGFKQLHEFLIHQENYLLALVEPVPKQVGKKRDKDLAHLSLEICSLENNIRLLQKKASQPAHEFLQDPWKSFDRCQDSPGSPRQGTSRRRASASPRHISPRHAKEHLTKRRRSLLPSMGDIYLSASSDEDIIEVLLMLDDAMTYRAHFRDCRLETLANACLLNRAHVTLDANSHHPQLLLSHDRQSVKWTHSAVTLPNSHKRFEKNTCVVGCQEFTIGRHFWEVKVIGQGDWAVGVARSSVKRKGYFNLCTKEGVFAVGKLEQQYRVIDVPHRVHLLLDGELRRIRVSVNCSGGEVNFYDVATATRICGFTELACFQETFLPFFWLNGPIQLSLKQ
uniref:E3 ubiquitin-protein ligase TRIM7-like n=1 Tax=Euleptes europaea TaxID=460621 RepID=UPI002540B9AE|nr:E3 ubiquitin-protein ligase TRIM7-like [Euleptes europaea]